MSCGCLVGRTVARSRAFYRLFAIFSPEATARPTAPGKAAVSTSLLDKRETRIRRMFGNIAPSYDLLNHLLSLNIDRYWRWRTTRLVPPAGEAPILDVCTGTGDLALAYDRAARGRAAVIGSDFCHEMLMPAREKVHKRRATERIRY